MKINLNIYFNFNSFFRLNVLKEGSFVVQPQHFLFRVSGVVMDLIALIGLYGNQAGEPCTHPYKWR